MPISSLLLHVNQEENVDQVVKGVDSVKDATVSEIMGLKLVVVTETTSLKDDKHIFETLEKIPGVAKLDLIYCNFEDVEEAL